MNKQAPSAEEIASEHLHEHLNAANLLQDRQQEIIELSTVFVKTLQAGGKILFVGNGGSAADSQHLATELVVRYRKNRPALSALALTTDTSALTAGGNDLGFDEVFSRQVEALGQKGDLLVAMSTSGTSPNILSAVKKAHELEVTTLGFTGNGGGDLNKLCNFCFCAPSSVTAVIQECHLLVGHILCDICEQSLEVSGASGV